MKIGVISDTHIPQSADKLPEKLLTGLKGVDLIIHAGDIGDLAVISSLKRVCKKIKAVHGNMDPPEIQKKFPKKDVFLIHKHKVGLMHGYGTPQGIPELAEKAFKKDKVDIIIFGHSHAALNEIKNGILFFNPGSPTDKVFAAYNSYGIIEIDDCVRANIIKI